MKQALGHFTCCSCGVVEVKLAVVNKEQNIGKCEGVFRHQIAILTGIH